MNEFDFDRLLDRYEKGLLTGKEKEMLEAWLHEIDTENVTPLGDTEMARVKNNIKSQIRFPAEASRWSGYWKITRIAASVLIVLAIGIWAFYPTTKSNNLKTTSGNGAITRVTLPDGTLVWLKGNSSLESPDQFSGETRNVVLHGEALFEVTKDPAHPFVIESGKIITTVLGTSFNLKTITDQVELTVLTGKVSLRSCDEATGIVVMPNERVVYGSQKLLISRENIAPDEKVAAVNGTEYSMLFNDAALGEIFDRIEAKFDVKISLSDDAMRNCRIRADFSDQSLSETMDMICQALFFRYTVNGKAVHLTGEGCR